MFKKNRAQTTLEYSLLSVCFIATIFIAGNYLNRGIQGGMRQAADSIGEQYDPINNDSKDINVVRDSVTVSKFNKDNEVFWLRKDASINVNLPFDMGLVEIPMDFFACDWYRRVEDVVSKSYTWFIYPDGSPANTTTTMSGYLDLDPLEP